MAQCVPIELQLGDCAFKCCPVLQSILTWSYGWDRLRSLVRHLVIARRVVFFCFVIMAVRHCAPGGRWAELDRLAFLADFCAESI